MKNKVSKTLISLAELDTEIRVLTESKLKIETRQSELSEALTAARERMEELQASQKEALSRQSLEEHRLRDEEVKIIERRKQLTALGGAKSAKLVERELEIAGRVLETLEAAVSDSISATERIEAELAAVTDHVQSLEEKSSAEGEETEQLSEIEKSLTGFEKQRKTAIGKIDDRLKNLYNRVNTRYIGDAVALATDGSCRSCYRSLPPQTYNQIMAGNMLIQCPGCSRILVYEPGS